MTGIFGDLFDLDGDGKLDTIEHTAELIFLDEMLKDDNDNEDAEDEEDF